jgi:hypothetical protein
MSTLICTVQGQSQPMIAGSFRASYSVNNRPTASFSLYNENGALLVQEGDDVIITDAVTSDTVFGGKIVHVTYDHGLGGSFRIAVGCAGWEMLTDRRIVAEFYERKTSGFIVKDLISKYLAIDGITEGNILDGLRGNRVVFGYIPLSEALRKLADANGFVWYINANKELNFTSCNCNQAPFDIDFDDPNKKAIRNTQLQSTLTQYRNRQFVQYDELTSLRTERFAGDGETKTFTVEFPIVLKPRVFVNNVEKTVGVSGLNEQGTNDFYFSFKNPSIIQDEFDTPLAGQVVDLDTGIVTPPDTIEIQYFGTFPSVTEINEESEQTSRIAIEGGSGLYESFQKADQATNESEAIDIANAILTKYGNVPQVFTFQGRQKGAYPGQFIDIDWSPLGVSGQFLIDKMDIIDTSAHALWYSYRCVSGSNVGNWQEFWRSLRPESSFSFDGQEVLPLGRVVLDQVELQDTAETLTLSVETDWDEGLWDQMEWQ